ncbi:MAG: hypothetical protein ALAOOOJD_02029 [bacterium]|nr:hypothetical protein [bacterium]
MLLLLLRTRLRYYRNYLRHHFDRMVWLEIGFIIIILFYLAGRSPADIGYSLKFLAAKDFPLHYARQWAELLPLFYLVSEALALLTLRPTGEWQLLGGLPVPKSTMTNYHLLRHGSKILVLLLAGMVPFWIGETSLSEKLARFLLALGFLLALQFTSFIQAFRWRDSNKKLSSRVLIWLSSEIVILFLLVSGAPLFQNFLLESHRHLSGLFAGWSLSAMALFYLRRIYQPGVTENVATSDRPGRWTARTFKHFGHPRGIVDALIRRDLKFLWIEKRALFVLMAFAAAILLLAGLAQTHVEEVYASSIVIETFFCFLLSNALLILFEHEAKTAAAMRALPISATTCWRARWSLATGLLTAPMILVIGMIPFKFAIGAGFLLFLAAALLIPMTFATLFCNAGYGLFPNIKYGSVLLNISLGLMLLFWFYMPFGTILLLAISLLWIRKAQRHFQFLEIS